jgi:surface antigen
MTSTRRLARAALALSIPIGALASVAQPAQAVTGYRVTATAGLSARTGPGTGYGFVRTLPYNTALDIGCQQPGETIGGNYMWDRLADNTWVADYWTSTPSYNSYIPGVQDCRNVSAPPPPTSTRKSISSNPFAPRYSDQCTFYAEERMHQQTGLYMPVYGNAYQWADQARAAGWTVGSAPAVNSVVVFPAGSFGSNVGHVAWTVQVSGNQVRIQDYNWMWKGAVVTDHWVTLPSGTQFIYSDR